MDDTNNIQVDLAQARTFLAGYYRLEPLDVALIGAGAWSRCFGFRHGDAELAIRFGKYVEDFQKDQLAHAYTSPDLPIPQVLDIGRAFDGYYAISTRVHGGPLENLNASQWLAALPSVVAALEAMRLADLSATSGVGGWGMGNRAPYACWSERLLTVADDTPAHRIYGWRQRLATSAQGEADFAWGFDLLKKIVDDSIAISLVHGDLINRNVLVDGTQISGVFDWGCSVYGDHLYDLAWFQFWAPWHPELDVDALHSQLKDRWQEVGYVPKNFASRLAACHLHIGLDHLAYNAYLGDWETLAATAARMRALVDTYIRSNTAYIGR